MPPFPPTAKRRRPLELATSNQRNLFFSSLLEMDDVRSHPDISIETTRKGTAVGTAVADSPVDGLI